MKIGALLGKLASKAGVDTTSEDWKAILALEQEVPDAASTKIDNSLLNIEAAKNNSEVTKAIKAQVLAGADARIEAVMLELGLTADDDFKGEKNTFEKIARLTKLAQEAGKKASGSSSKQTADEFAAKEKEYNDQIKALKETLTNKDKEFSEAREADQINFELHKTLAVKDYIFPAEMDSTLKVNTAAGAIQQELLKKGFSFKKNEAGQLVLVNKEGTPAYGADNVAIEPNTFIDGVLTQNKLLRLNDPNAGKQHGSGGAAGGGVPAGGNQNSAMVAELDNALQNLP